MFTQLSFAMDFYDAHLKLCTVVFVRGCLKLSFSFTYLDLKGMIFVLGTWLYPWMFTF